MSSSLLARALLLALALSFLFVPAAFAEDPNATRTDTTTATTSDAATTTATEPTTTEPTTTEPATSDGSTTTTEQQAEASSPDPWAETPQTRELRARALHYRAVARGWRKLMRRPMPHIRTRLEPFDSLLAERRWQMRAWRAKARRARYAGHHPRRLGAWICIHRHEGSWRDPNAPYYGGLQMDMTFQRQYALGLLRRKGTADHWSRFEQIWVAERAYRAGRGFWPWPLTARRCGLI